MSGKSRLTPTENFSNWQMPGYRPSNRVNGRITGIHVIYGGATKLSEFVLLEHPDLRCREATPDDRRLELSQILGRTF